MGVFSLSFSPVLAGVDGTFKGRAEEGISDRETVEARLGPAQFMGHQLGIIIDANNTFSQKTYAVITWKASYRFKLRFRHAS
jgi:hypothetical protein